MRIAPKDQTRFAARPDPGMRLYLVFGSDAGLVRELGEKLVAALARDPDDPFQVTRLSGSDLEQDPARLYDAVNSISLTGDKPLVHIRNLTRKGQAPLSALLQDKAAQPQGWIVAESTVLGNRDSLVKQAIKAPDAAAIACYQDSQASLDDLIGEILAPCGHTIAPDARRQLKSLLGADRLLSRREIEKLALYAGTEPREITIEDIEACIGDVSAFFVDQLCDAAACGESRRIPGLLARCQANGIEAAQILASFGNHFDRLLAIKLAANDQPISESMLKRMQPPVHFSRIQSFMKQLRRWNKRQLLSAIEIILNAEEQTRRTGAPATSLCERTVMQLSTRSFLKNRG